MAKLILVEGPDNSGKTTFINELQDYGAVLLNFPKATSAGRFSCESRNEVAIFETMLNYLDESKVYILDRGYLSNIVYESVLRDKDTTAYVEDFIRLKQTHDLKVIALTRNKIDVSFKDDLISVDSESFNKIIEMFNSVYRTLGITPYKYLNHDSSNALIDVLSITPILDDVKAFIGE